MKKEICSCINNSYFFNDIVYEHLISLYGIEQVNEIIMEVIRNKDIDIKLYNKIVASNGNKCFTIANNLFIVRACELLEELNNIFISLGYTDKKFINKWMDDKVSIVSSECNDSDILSKISELYKEFVFFRNKVCDCNLNLLRSSIKGYKDKYMYDELYQEGFIGLMNAIEKFDYKGDVKFSTYAVLRITYAIKEHKFDYEFSVSIPRDKINIYHNIIKIQEEARNNLDRELTLEELADKMGIKVSTLSNYLYFSNFLDTCVDLRTDKSLEFTDNDNRLIETEVVDDSLETIMNNFLDNFRDKDKLIIKYRFYGDKIRTFDEVGKLMGVSRQYVNADYNRILKRMRIIGKELKRYY